MPRPAGQVGGEKKKPRHFPAGLLRFDGFFDSSLHEAPPAGQMTVMMVVMPVARLKHRSEAYHGKRAQSKPVTRSGVTSASVATIRSASASRFLGDVVGSAIVFIPAARAAARPDRESSTATHSPGGMPSRAAASRYGIGDGFVCV